MVLVMVDNANGVLARAYKPLVLARVCTLLVMLFHYQTSFGDFLCY